jgi:hypothetical protein
MNECPKLPHYDPDYCLRVAKWAASVCVGILVVELVGMLLVTPDEGKCPGWTIYAENGSATPGWLLAGIFTGFPTVWICYVALHWEQEFSERFYDSIAYRKDYTPTLLNLRQLFPNMGFGSKSPISRPKVESRELDFEKIFLLNANRLFLRVCIMWCLFCAAPLLMMVTGCTNALQYFGY